ncbi:MAG: helix-turn-helix transcriptional regulator [Chthoniobacterales bacterium]|nr:helix-turn-helix transcriptional regulator [Chthoniobacterales bacterium]
MRRKVARNEGLHAFLTARRGPDGAGPSSAQTGPPLLEGRPPCRPPRPTTNQTERVAPGHKTEGTKSPKMFFANPLIEALPDTRRSALRVKSFRKACVDFHWHFHPEIELICVEKGSGVRYVGHSMEPFSDGDLCLIGPNIPHAFGSFPARRQGAQWLVGHFLPEIWGKPFWQLPEMRRIAELLRKSHRGLRFDPRETQDIQKKFHEAEAAASRGLRLALWLEILDRLAICRKTHILNPSAFPEARPDPRLQKLLVWLEAHADEPEMTQAQAAATCGLSPQAFCRFFREKTGRPFRRYVNEVRIARACGSLLDNDRPIAEIAFTSGFGTLANFNRRFREITGVTPGDYRTKHGGVAQTRRLSSGGDFYE